MLRAANFIVIFGHSLAINGCGVPQNQLDQQRPILGVAILESALRDLGYEPLPWLTAAGIAPSLLHEPLATVTAQQEFAFVQAALDAGVREDIGLVTGRRYHFGVFGIMGLAMITAPTAAESFSTAVQFTDLNPSYAEMTLRLNKNTAVITLVHDYSPGALQRFMLERDFVSILVVAGEAVGRHISLANIQFAFPKPSYADAYTQLFEIEPVFDAPTTAVTVDRSILEQTLPNANAFTYATCLRQCEVLQEQLQIDTGFLGKVRQYLVSHIHASPSIVEAADHFAVSERTLRRRLADEGTSFRKLLLEVRLTMAEDLLGSSSLTVEAIAERLGYSDAANFSHAFSAAKGRSPGQYRRTMQSC